MNNFKFHFKNNLPHQDDAIKSVLNLFEGMEKKNSPFTVMNLNKRDVFYGAKSEGVGNNITIDKEEFCHNIENIQKKNGLMFEEENKKNCIVPKDFTIEMETGTGKTYVYIKTALELVKEYGLKKFIIVVPSVAIREGVYKTFEITKEHFEGEYEPYDYFIYNSSNFSAIKNFATSKKAQFMIINISAFNTKDNKINKVQEQMDGNIPIDLIKQVKPVVIIDEPQSVIGQDNKKKKSAGFQALQELTPSLVLRYSATHRARTHELYRLDAIDAYNQGLVKEIYVSSVTVDEDFNEPYIYLVSVDREKKEAKLRLNIKAKGRYVRKVKTVNFDTDLQAITGNSKYAGFKVKEIVFEEKKQAVKISNLPYNLDFEKHREFGSTNDDDIKRFQIRQTISEHLDKEVTYRLPHKDRGRIKVLSLFFIDKVSNYVNYEGKIRVRNGKYAKMFEEEYKLILEEKIDKESNIDRLEILNEIKKYDFDKVHNGYFSNDKATSFRDYTWNNKKEEYNLTTKDDKVFDEIMRDKERLLNLDNELRFIFSHSALKEGWDNPNVFQICTLNETKSEIKKRQEIGRGLRLAVDEFGNRIEEGTERFINKLTVMVNESYEEFTEGLQKEYSDAGIEFGLVKSDTFTHLPSKVAETIGGEKSLEIFKFLKEEKYLDKKGNPTPKLRKDIEEDKFILPEELKLEQEVIEKKLLKLAKPLTKDVSQKIEVKRNEKVMASPEFISLWNKIKYKTRYEYKLDIEKLIKKSIKNLEDLDIETLNIIAKKSNIVIEDEGMSNGENTISGISSIKKDKFPNVLEDLQNSTSFSRNDIAKILLESKKLYQIKKNPERFILEVSKRLNDSMNEYAMEEECIRYVKLGETECYVQENIFEESRDVFDKFVLETKEKSIYPHFEYDSSIEYKFAKELENNKNVILYTKLPDSFFIETPLGNYNPDWAIVYDSPKGYKIYFVIETKGSTDSMDRRGKENYKIHCAKLHFDAISEGQDERIHYEVAKDIDDLNKLGIKL